MLLYRQIYSIALLIVILAVGNTLIIPNELPSILSVIYSNIPTIKKGTDSRIGWGFRLGDRADFQVLVELGPQIYTKPLANQPENNNNLKRNVANTLRDTIYARQQLKKATDINNNTNQTNDVDQTDGAKWLKKWREQLIKPEKVVGIADEEIVTKLGVGEIDAKSVLPPE